MTRSELVEAMARAEAASHYADRFKKPADDPHVTMNVNGNWSSFASQCDRALSAIEQAGLVVVPDDALKWLNGEGPDDEGHHFGDSPESRASLRPDWWRKVFTRMIEAGRIK